MSRLVDLIRHTKVYQEAYQEGFEEAYQKAFEEGKRKILLETVPRLLQMGLNSEQIAEILNLPEQVVQQTATQQNTFEQNSF